MKDRPIGRIVRDGDEFTLLLEREYPVPIESVWNALVEPDKLARWLAPVRHDGRVGGRFAIDFGAEQPGGIIRVWEPPRALAFDWGEDGGASLVRFDLEPTDAGTRLLLTHSRQSAELASGTGPGWHAHLDVLGVILEGGTFDLKNDYRSLYTAAKPRYAGTVPATAPDH